jgi:hypothetical protein
MPTAIPGFVVRHAVVLKVAGLPEPPMHKPSDTMPFLFPPKVWFEKMVILE